MERVIWQYWETRGKKPAYIDGLHAIAARNAGVPVVRVTPETLRTYLPDLPAPILGIGELAHKADMIRVLLVREHGGMWLDSDALVLKDLNPLFDRLEEAEFVGFNELDPSEPGYHKVRVNCFLSRPGGWIISEWARRQHAKFPRLAFEWNEIGADMLDPICRERPELARILPFRSICPVPWDQTDRFASRRWGRRELAGILEGCWAVMMSNSVLTRNGKAVVNQTVEEIAESPTLLGHLIRAAMDPGHRGPTGLGRLFEQLTGRAWSGPVPLARRAGGGA